MLKKRIIPIQLLMNGRLVKTVGFDTYRDVGDPVQSSKVYNAQDADELVFLNINRGDRTIDQMVQAARSGKQNIVEGDKAAKTSKETELKLTNVARASLEELLIDYGDFLRTHRAAAWNKDSREARYVRRLGANPELKFEGIRGLTESRPGPVVANMAICLVHQGNFLLDRLIGRLEQDFLKEGGLRERMTRARLEYRNRRRE